MCFHGDLYKHIKISPLPCCSHLRGSCAIGGYLYASDHLSCLKLIKARGLRDVRHKIIHPSNAPPPRLQHVTAESTNYVIFPRTIIPDLLLYPFRAVLWVFSSDLQNRVLFFFSLNHPLCESSLLKEHKRERVGGTEGEMTGGETCQGWLLFNKLLLRGRRVPAFLDEPGPFLQHCEVYDACRPAYFSPAGVVLCLHAFPQGFGSSSL